MYAPTPTQDRLARGKPAPAPAATSRPQSDASRRTGDDAAPPLKKKTSDEVFTERDRRDAAARVVGSWELLAMWASAGVESVPQTRRRFEKMMMGLPEEKGDQEWEDCFEEEGGEEGEGSGKREGRSVRRGEKGEGRRQRKG